MKNQQQRTIGKNQKNRKMFGIALFLTFFCIFVLFVVRFFVIATTKDVQNRNLQTMASRMYTSKRIIEAKRGTIYDAQGNALAQDTKTYTVTAVLSHQSLTAKGKPNYVTNKKKAAKVLAKYLDITEKKALSIMSPKRKNVYQVEFGPAGSGISVSTMKKIKAQHVTGLQFTSTPARQYPAGEFASQLIGLATAKTNDKTGQTKLVGRLGLESYCNKNLTGINGLKEIKQDVYGYQLADSQVKGRPAKDGADVYTTLDNRTQQQLETLITKAEKETALYKLINDNKPKIITLYSPSLSAGHAVTYLDAKVVNKKGMTKDMINEFSSIYLQNSQIGPIPIEISFSDIINCPDLELDITEVHLQ